MTISFAEVRECGLDLFDVSTEGGTGRRGLANDTALKKFTSYSERHSSGVLSAILFTGLRVP